MTTSHPAPPGTLALFSGLTLLLLAACASTAPGAASGPQSSSGSGSAAPAGTARPQPASSPPTTAPTASPGACPHDGTPITIRPGDQPAPVCLYPGGTLTLTAGPSPTQPWQPLTTTNPAILTCTTQPHPDGALTATCRALQPGTATVSTTTAAFSGDPHGPAQYIWTLTIEVRVPS